MQGKESGMHVLSERVAALERMIPELDDKMEKHFKIVMDSLGQLTGSLLPDRKGSCNPSAPVSRTQSDTSPEKGVILVSVSNSDDLDDAGMGNMEGADDGGAQSPMRTEEASVKGMMSICIRYLVSSIADFTD